MVIPGQNLMLTITKIVKHDDYMTAEDYERREYYRNGWDAERYDSQRW